jgi:predicted O-linked N-acetylglucosamine transferase (SPINDLY family)
MQADLEDAHRFLAEHLFDDAAHACERRLRDRGEDAEARQLLGLARDAARSGPLRAAQIFRLGAALQKAGLHGAAAREYRQVIALRPNAAEAHNNLGSALEALGDTAQAEACFAQALRLKPDYVRALNNVGGLRLRTGRAADACSTLERAVEVRPEHAEAWLNLGAARRALGRLEEAAAAYRRSIELQPQISAAHFNLAIVHEELGDRDAARAACAEAARLDPTAAGPRVLRGLLLLAEGQTAAANAAFAECADAAPASPDLALGLCGRLEAAGRVPAAIELAQNALRRAENHDRLRLEIARMCRSVRRFDAAHAVLAPLLVGIGSAEAWSSAAFTFLQDGAERRDPVRLRQSITAFESALALEPDRLPERLALAMALTDGDRGDLALPHVERVLSAGPPDAPAAAAAATLLEIQGFCVEPARYDVLAASIRAAVQSGIGSVPPLHVVLRFDEPALIQAAARAFIAGQGIPAAPRRASTPRRNSRLRVGYISPDFHHHPVAHAIAPVIEQHDRTRFETIGIAIHTDDGSRAARRVRSAFERLVDGTVLDALSLAAQIRELDLDVLVDLGGLTANSRPRALAMRPAPVQVSYLGYPATSGCPWLDYVIADRFVIPPDARQYFDEQVVWLPDTFLAGDSPPTRAISGRPTRESAGLPDDVFVFCNFNLPQRLNPPALESFFRILAAAPSSVLWMRDPGREKARILRERAEERGVAGGRIVFANYAPTREAHLERLALADLFLDSLPYNAHTTARESLAVGVPVLTCAGASFAGRVAGSVLKSLGLDELIATELTEFEQLAVTLSRDEAARAALRQRVAAAAAGSAAFNPLLQARQLEAAFSAMHSRACDGLPPAPISAALG